MYESCDECFGINISERISDHDESLTEYICRDCGMEWVEPNGSNIAFSFNTE